MPVHQINVNPPDWRPSQPIEPSSNASSFEGESVSKWASRVSSISRLISQNKPTLSFFISPITCIQILLRGKTSLTV